MFEYVFFLSVLGFVFIQLGTGFSPGNGKLRRQSSFSTSRRVEKNHPTLIKRRTKKGKVEAKRMTPRKEEERERERQESKTKEKNKADTQKNKDRRKVTRRFD
mmetsp:Transcript_16251/g.18285  ORF Transcript_16251/g.18285 Transcript_16251/m.18285 type:complete len:103 (+) Transcript_16251:866-1174(+)